MSSQPGGAILLEKKKMIDYQNKFIVSYLEDQDMWGVFFVFDSPQHSRSEWYTEEEASHAAAIEEEAFKRRK